MLKPRVIKEGKKKRRRSGNDAVDFLREKWRRRMSFEWKNLPSRNRNETRRLPNKLRF